MAEPILKSQTGIADGMSDAALVAEIAPAMLAKLRKDGSFRGGTLGSSLFCLWTVFFMADLALQNRDATARMASMTTLLWALAAVSATSFVLPFYFKKRSVAAEVRYRRQHGKWRWER